MVKNSTSSDKKFLQTRLRIKMKMRIGGIGIGIRIGVIMMMIATKKVVIMIKRILAKSTRRTITRTRIVLITIITVVI